MKKIIMVFLAVILFCTGIKSQSVGLVMSGGGARGIAHIGLIQALEENNVPIDYVAGTSMGAIVGALYAMGYTPEEMIQLILSDDFNSWSRGILEDDYIYYFKKPEPTPEFVTFNLGIQDSSKITPHFLPRSLINPLPMNFAFMRIFAPYSAQANNDFNQLFVPFRAVASDVYHKRAVILRNGDLGDAVRASMSFPFVFKPIEIDSVLVYDGGIYNNFPVDVMKEDFNPDVIIGSVVATEVTKPKEDNLMTQIENMVMQKSDYTVDPKDGILLKFDLKGVELLDFPNAKEIYQIGYDKAISMIDSIKGRIPREIPLERKNLQRKVFKSKTPKLEFDRVNIKGANHAQTAYIKKQFTDNKSGVLSEAEAKEAYYKIISDGKISDLIPHAIYNPETGMFDLNLQAKVKDRLALGIGGFIASNSSNQICLGAHYRTVSLNSLDLDLTGQIGQSYNSGMLTARIDLPSSIPMFLKFMGVLSKHKFYESDKLFYSDKLPTFISKNESYLKLRLGLPFLTKAKAEVSLGYGYLFDDYYQSNNIDFAQNKSDRSKYLLWMGSMRFEKNNLDNFMYPTTGNEISITGEVVYGSERYLEQGKKNNNKTYHSWLQMTAYGSKYFSLAKNFTLGIRGELVLSSKDFYDNYTATIVQAPAFTPTPHSKTSFNPAFRSTQYLAGGVVPIWKIIDNLQLRTEFYAFSPFFKIKEDSENQAYYGKFMNTVSFMGEVSIVYNLPFASISVYGNRYSYPKNNWNFGVNIGLLIFSPKFLE